MARIRSSRHDVRRALLASLGARGAEPLRDRSAFDESLPGLGFGNAVPDSAIYYDVKRVRDAGMTFVRGSHYPHPPAFYDACDELGVLVLDAQTGWQQYIDSPEFRSHTFQELRDMIRRDRNHPSVVAWEASLNESEFPEAWAAQAHAIVHEEYTTPPLAHGSIR